LTELFEQAKSVEEALNIQKEITRVQSDLEALEARIKFIESEAYSLIHVMMQAAPALMSVDAGPDIAVGVMNTGIPYEPPGVGDPSIFRARFTPPPRESRTFLLPGISAMVLPKNQPIG
jgi:hypothetical protein